jgi:hypothetical protein
MESSCERISYNDLPDFSHFITFSEAVEYIASCMLDDGITDVLALDLTNNRIGIPVIYVVAPFAEFDVSSAISEPGLRLCRFLEAQNLN